MEIGAIRSLRNASHQGFSAPQRLENAPLEKGTLFEFDAAVVGYIRSYINAVRANQTHVTQTQMSFHALAEIDRVYRAIGANGTPEFLRAAKEHFERFSIGNTDALMQIANANHSSRPYEQSLTDMIQSEKTRMKESIAQLSAETAKSAAKLESAFRVTPNKTAAAASLAAIKKTPQRLSRAVAPSASRVQRLLAARA